jgi:hypothetical protein
MAKLVKKERALKAKGEKMIAEANNLRPTPKMAGGASGARYNDIWNFAVSTKSTAHFTTSFNTLQMHELR